MKALPESGAKLVGWLDGQLKKLDEKASIRLSLRHIAGAKTMVVDRWNATRSSDATELAVDIGKAAQTDAHFMGGGVKRYELIAAVEGEQVGRFGLRVEEGEEEETDGGNQRYALNDAAVALVKQSQEHVHGLVKALVTLMIGTDKSRLAELDRLAARNEAIEAKFDKMRELIEASQDKQFDRDMKKKSFDNDQRRLDELIATGRVLAPFLVNGIAKKNLLPTGDNSLLKEALKPVMSEMTEEQLTQLQKIFKPSQLVGILEVWKMLNAESASNGNKEQSTTSS